MTEANAPAHKVKNQHIVKIGSRWQMLWECQGDKWFITSNGGFDQSEKYIEQIRPGQAKKILSKPQ